MALWRARLIAPDGGDLEGVPAAVGRIAAALDKVVTFQVVVDGDDCAGVDPPRSSLRCCPSGDPRVTWPVAGCRPVPMPVPPAR
jgi:hypothetical protein